MVLIYWECRGKRQQELHQNGINCEKMLENDSEQF